MSESEPPADAGTPRALVADDDPDIGRILRVFLTRLGFEVEVVRDGEAALAAIDRQPPCVLFTDYQMPRLGGLETLTSVKARHPEVRVVVVTAQSADEVVRKLTEAGADAYVEKPFTFARIAEACGRPVG